MKFRSTPVFILAIGMMLFMLACSNKKDGTAYRWYHNTTAHFNGYFNADEIVARGVKKFEDAQKEDYDKILPIFIYGDEAAAKASYPDMEKAIAKCEKVINRHTIKDETKKDRKKRPEYNKWIDENYMVVGRAYFYKRNYGKAADVFQYVNRKYKKPETVVNTNSWLARTYIQQEEYGKAIQALARAESEAEEKDVDEKVKAEYYMVYADVLLHQKKVDKAAEKMEIAIGHIKRKKDRARPHFILAQMYQELNRSSDALTHYEAVVHSKPVYELEFYARINKALSYSRTGGSSAEIQKQLFKMLKDDKNIDYRDQIYYALGDIAWEENRRTDAIDFYEKSLAANMENPKMKAKVFLRLADLYFDERQYVEAQLYYDSTLTTILAEHERYPVVKARAESLTELVASLNAIALNDSLSAICNLPEKERDRKLGEIQKRIEEQKAEQKAADEFAAQKAKEKAAAVPGGIVGNFWAYNPTLREKGKANFNELWGERPLKDNWRLQSRLAQSFGPGEEGGTTTETVTPEEGGSEEVVDKYAAPSVDDLKAALPCDDAAKMDQIKKDAAEGYYNAGVVYKEKLDDDDNAISTWEELLANMDDSDFHPTTYYQLFRTWLAKETSKGYVKNPLCDDCNSKHWGDEIKSRYPGSDWAMLVDNPGYLDVQDMKNQQENEKYLEAYSMYANRNYVEAKNLSDSVISAEPQNHLICKYRLLRAICVGYMDAPYGQKQNYQNELNTLVQTCAGTEEAARAQELLKAAKAGDTSSTQDEIKEEVKTDESTGETTPKDPVTDPTTEAPPIQEGPYKYVENAEHYFALILPVQGSDINKTKNAVAEFNTVFYTSAQLKVTNNLLDKDYHLLLIKSFKVMDEANNYVTAFITDTDKLNDVNNAGYRSFLISKQNYIALFKNKDIDQYMDFYLQHYH